jgi:hypothetical protein
MKTLVEELEETKNELAAAAASIKDDVVDTVPFEGSWTAGQVLEHIDKSVSPGVLNGNVRQVDRAADEKVQTVRTIFLDFTKKFEAPGFIIPTETSHDKQALVSKLNHKFDKLAAAAGTMDLAEECLDFEVPGLGAFTRLEWIAFYMAHTQRHIHQLKNIAARLNEAG